MKLFLRIGVLRDGRLVDDRYVPERGEVTVGSSAKNMFALLGSNLPKEHVLFHFQKTHPVLHLLEGMTGEISFDGKGKETLANVRQKARDGAVELGEHTRGWVTLSGATFFFQVLPKPPPPPRRELPKEAKTGFLSGFEPLFVGVLVAVTAVEGVGIFAIHRRPTVEIDQPSAEDLDRFAEIIMPEKPKEEPKKDEDDAKKKAEEEAKKRAEEDAKKKADEEAKKKKEEDEKPKDEAAQKKAEDERKAKIKEAVSKKGLLSVIGATGGNGALSNLFTSTGFSDDLSSALAGAGGIKVATGDDGPNRKGGTGGGAVGIGDLSGTVEGGGAKAGLAEKKRVAPQIAIDDSEFETESTSVDKDSLNKYIKLRLKSVQQCYEKELKLNPTLKGKIVVRFVVTTAGRVGDVTIDQNTMGSDNVAACISRLIRSWTFPFKPEEDAPVSFPFVFNPGG